MPAVPASSGLKEHRKRFRRDALYTYCTRVTTRVFLLAPIARDFQHSKPFESEHGENIHATAAALLGATWCWLTPYYYTTVLKTREKTQLSPALEGWKGCWTSIVFFGVASETNGKRGNMAASVTFGPYRCTDMHPLSLEPGSISSHRGGVRREACRCPALQQHLYFNPSYAKLGLLDCFCKG